jgi:hypothetical protein
MRIEHSSEETLMSRIVGWFRDRAERIRGWWLRMQAPGHFLCDSCKYDYGDVCNRPERPNATHCPDYRPR